MEINFAVASRWLDGLTVYRGLLRLDVLRAVREMLEEDCADRLSCYGRAFCALAEAGYDSLAAWLSDRLRSDEWPSAMAVAKGEETPALTRAAGHDLEALRRLLALPWEELAVSLSPEAPLPAWAGGELPSLEELTAFYRANGCGQFARYHAFLWQSGRLIPVREPDCIPAEEMLGYHRQRSQVAANTRAMLAGRRVNNVLLYGASGTGKSATVKALLAMDGMEGLRLIEVDKNDLTGIPELVRMLGHQPQKFILFIDDLAFDKDDHNYSLLKTILEGGVEPRPANVAVYATSNRRHLVRETFSDRLGDEVDASETIQEKTSLSERFGLRVLFQELTKPQFLEMIRELAKIRGVEMDPERLTALAVRWDIRNPNRTPRSAVQFLTSLAAME